MVKNNLYVRKKIVPLYVGLEEGNCVVSTNFITGVDSCLETIIQNAEIISVINWDLEKSPMKKFLVLKNGATIELTKENQNRLYDYFVFNAKLKELEE